MEENKLPGDRDPREEKTRIVKKILLVFIGIVVLLMWGCPRYHVYQEYLGGQAELARANSNRQIAIQEAHAKMEAAKDLAQAEILRAEGVAKANTIIGESLKDNESYLRYLWIQNLEHTPNTTIYVPTEAGLPILEAGRWAKKQEENK